MAKSKHRAGFRKRKHDFRVATAEEVKRQALLELGDDPGELPLDLLEDGDLPEGVTLEEVWLEDEDGPLPSFFRNLKGRNACDDCGKAGESISIGDELPELVLLTIDGDSRLLCHQCLAKLDDAM